MMLNIVREIILKHYILYLTHLKHFYLKILLISQQTSLFKSYLIKDNFLIFLTIFNKGPHDLWVQRLFSDMILFDSTFSFQFVFTDISRV